MKVFITTMLAATMVVAATAVQAGILVSLRDVETGVEWTFVSVGEVRELYGGSIVELCPPPTNDAHSLHRPARLFGKEYRDILRETGRDTLAHHTIWWRVDRKGRKPLTVVDGIRLGIIDSRRVDTCPNDRIR